MGLKEFLSSLSSLFFGPYPRVALVCRGGPENGPFSAMAAKLITEGLARVGVEVLAIYASSGSVPTAIMGCTGDFEELCSTWRRIRPIDIVGKISRLKVIQRLISSESMLTTQTLGTFIRGKRDLDKIFSDAALETKFPAVDILSNEYVIFSNKNPKHKKWFDVGALGSMALTPFLSPQFIFDPEESDLIAEDRASVIKQPKNRKEKKQFIGEIAKRAKKEAKDAHSAMLLIDGGFRGNMLLEEAVRDGFDVIFLIDIHGLKPTAIDLHMRYRWDSLIRFGFHLLSNMNDVRQFQLTARINEEIRIKKRIKYLLKILPGEFSKELEDIITQMNEGRLRLGDKQEAQIYIVSNEKRSALFNFVKFGPETVPGLLKAGCEADIRTVR